MRAVEGASERGPYVSLVLILGALTVLAFAVLTGLPVLKVAPLIGLVVVSAVWSRTLLAWPSLLGALILVILFIPIRRYAMPGNLPFELEPYRLLVAFVAAGWLSSLLVDRRTCLRRGVFGLPLFAIAAGILASVIINGDRIHELGVGDVVAKKLTFVASFFVVLYVIVSVVRDKRDIDALVKILVGGGAILALFGLIEYRTEFNVFNHLSRFLPILELRDVLTAEDVARGGRLRVYGSAQHPIALGALLIMLLPLALYLARSRAQRRWWFTAGLLALGALATLSRTSILMLVVIAAVFLWLRPIETRRLWPVLLPALVVVHLVLPGTIGTLRASFFPEGGLIAEQQISPGGRGSGRVADLGPSLSEWSKSPVLGQGFGTRVVDEERANALILDNQWLGTLLETGLVGALAWFWLFRRAVRRFGRAAKDDESDSGWLMAALAASLAAFAVGMLTFDAFSFIQVTFVAFILLGLGGVMLASGREHPRTDAGRRISSASS